MNGGECIDGVALPCEFGQDLTRVLAFEQGAAVASRNPLHQHIDIGVEPDRYRLVEDQGSRLRVHERAASRRDNVAALLDQTRDDPPFPISKAVFAEMCENFRYRHAGGGGDFLIRVDEGKPQSRGEPSTNCRFSRTHHPYENDRAMIPSLCRFPVPLHDGRGYTAMRPQRKSQFAAIFLPDQRIITTGIMKFKRTDSNIISQGPRRRTRLPIVPLTLAVLLVLLLVWAWQRGGEQPQTRVEKPVPAAKLGQ